MKNVKFEEFATKDELFAFLRKAELCRTKAEMEKWMRANVPKESYYQKACLKTIRELVPDAFAWKVQAGAYSQGGIPDICAIIKGRYYGFEVKRPFIGIVSDLQSQTMTKIHRAGGKAYVVSFPRDVRAILVATGCL